MRICGKEPWENLKTPIKDLQTTTSRGFFSINASNAKKLIAAISRWIEAGERPWENRYAIEARRDEMTTGPPKANCMLALCSHKTKKCCKAEEYTRPVACDMDTLSSHRRVVWRGKPSGPKSPDAGGVPEKDTVAAWPANKREYQQHD